MTLGIWQQGEAAFILAAAGDTAGVSASESPLRMLFAGGPMIWVLLLTGAFGAAYFIERLVYYHRAQISASEFLAGMRNVLKNENVVEALAICDATPGPVARLVKTAILNREQERELIRESLEDAGLVEVPRLEKRLNLLATVAQIAPLMGLLGTVLGFIRVFRYIQEEGAWVHAGQMAAGVWEGLVCTALGLAVAIPCYAGYNYLVGRVNEIVLDMEKATSEIVTILTVEMQPNGAKSRSSRRTKK